MATAVVAGGGGIGSDPFADDDDTSRPLLSNVDDEKYKSNVNGSTTPANTDANGIRSASSDTTDGSSDGEVKVEGGDGEPAQKKISNIDTIIHLLKGNIGTGILAMPDAFKNSGTVVGFAGLCILSFICVHCMHMLVGCATELGQRLSVTKGLSYPDIAEKAFETSRLRRYSKTAKNVINIFLCITQLGFCCVYFVFVSQNLKLVCDHHFHELDYHVYMAIVLPFVLALASVRNLKYLSPISMIANVVQFLGLIAIFFYVFEDMPPTWERKKVATWAQLPLYFGTAIYAFEGIGVVMPLENQMKHPEQLRGWNGVLNTAMVIVTCLYIAVGFFGYVKYGDNVQGSITLNLPVEETLAQMIILAMSLSIYFSYALQFYVPIELALPSIKRKFPNHPVRAEYAFRYIVVLFTFALAAAIPKLDLFISLVGAVSSSTLALLAPATIDIITFWPHMGPFKYRLWKNIFIFLIGFLGFVSGTYVSMKNIIDYFINGDSQEEKMEL